MRSKPASCKQPTSAEKGARLRRVAGRPSPRIVGGILGAVLTGVFDVTGISGVDAGLLMRLYGVLWLGRESCFSARIARIEAERLCGRKPSAVRVAYQNCEFRPCGAVATVGSVNVRALPRHTEIAMALLKFEPPKELAPLRVKIARSVHERVERYREFCGALELADLVERALVYVMARDADFRGSATPRAKVERRRRPNRVSPADKAGGAP